MIVRANIKTHWVEVHRGISIIQHFDRGELNYVKQGTLRGGFSLDTETGR